MDNQTEKTMTKAQWKTFAPLVNERRVTIKSESPIPDLSGSMSHYADAIEYSVAQMLRNEVQISFDFSVHMPYKTPIF